MPDLIPHDFSSPLIDEALAWLVRIHSGQASEDDRHAFQAWQAHSADHRLAAQEAETLWREIGSLRSADRSHNPTSVPPLCRSQQVGTGKATWAIAACLILTIGWFASDGIVEWFTVTMADHHTVIGQQHVVTLPDGSHIHLNSDSAVNVVFTEQERTVHLMKGEAAFSVSPDANRPFIVRSRNLHARALGTAFIVRLHQDAVTVTVTEHTVHLSTTNRNRSSPLILREGEQTSYSAETGFSPVHPVNLSLVTAWQRGKLIVDSKPLAEVVDELNRYRPGRIMILNPALRPLKVTGLFDITDPEAALRMIADTLQIHGTALTFYVVLLH
ncbi:MAG: hypothetical protein OJF47_001289 [Nitrospira sp.]|jgi:transmembrane sensor|nr:MAG: hypothetical protein OJF47_001289 [Nitrospira sp.]